MKRSILALSIFSIVAFGVAQAQPGDRGNFSATDIAGKVEAAGYSQVSEIEFDDGFWEVKAVDGRGVRTTVLVDPRSGELIDANAMPQLSAADIANQLQSQGYRNVRDIELDDGRYEVEATNPAGYNVDLKVDPRDGRILEEDIDD